MAHLIECPHCASRFVTIFSSGKVERCPYCGRDVVHDDPALRNAARPFHSKPEALPKSTSGPRALSP